MPIIAVSRVKGDTEYNNLLINHCYRDRKWMNESRSKTATVVRRRSRNKILAMILFDCSEGRAYEAEKENCLNALPKKNRCRRRCVWLCKLRPTLIFPKLSWLARRCGAPTNIDRNKNMICFASVFSFPFSLIRKGRGRERGKRGG